jgi:hypothetical protein
MKMTHNIPTTPAEFDETRIIERPDGYWWQSKDGGREHGPFETMMDAVSDMGGGDDSPDVTDDDFAEAIREAEDVLGVPDWVDPDTGHLADDEHTRIEDH